MQLDASTAAAIAALVVAVVAMVIAFAQALQQYISSGALMRLGDRTVFGGMPGGSKRRWSWTQFRYRVLYEMPEVRLPRAYYSLRGLHGGDDKDDENEDDYGELMPFTTTPPLYATEIGRRTFGPVWPSLSHPEFEAVLKRLTVEFLYHPWRAILKRPQLLLPLIMAYLNHTARKLKRIARSTFLSKVPSKLMYMSETATPNEEKLDANLDESDQSLSGGSNDDLEATALGFLVPTYFVSFADPSVACWHTFWAFSQYRCGIRTRYTMRLGDADRCPGDLQVLPMPVLLKDIVTVGFLMGLEVVTEDRDRRLVQMEGEVGLLISSPHPLLGTIVRYFPRFTPSRAYITHPDTIALLVARIWGRSSVAGNLISDSEADVIARWNHRLEVHGPDLYALTIRRTERHRMSSPFHEDGIRVGSSVGDNENRSQVQTSEKITASQDQEGLDEAAGVDSMDGKPALPHRILSDTNTDEAADGQGISDQSRANIMTNAAFRRPPTLMSKQLGRAIRSREIKFSGDAPKTISTSSQTAARNKALFNPISQVDFGLPKHSQTLPSAFERADETDAVHDERLLEAGRFGLRRVKTEMTTDSKSVAGRINQKLTDLRPTLVQKLSLQSPDGKRGTPLKTSEQLETKIRRNHTASDEQNRTDFKMPSRRSTWNEEIRSRKEETEMGSGNNFVRTPTWSRAARPSASYNQPHVDRPPVIPDEGTSNADAGRFTYRPTRDLQDELEELEGRLAKDIEELRSAQRKHKSKSKTSRQHTQPQNESAKEYRNEAEREVTRNKKSHSPTTDLDIFENSKALVPYKGKSTASDIDSEKTPKQLRQRLGEQGQGNQNNATQGVSQNEANEDDEGGEPRSTSRPASFVRTRTSQNDGQSESDSEPETSDHEFLSSSSESRSFHGASKCLGSLYWLCQMDVIPGYFISKFATCIDRSFCNRAANLLLETLKLRLRGNTLRWIDADKDILGELDDKLSQGFVTWPLYAYNSRHRGSGDLKSREVTRWPCFSEPPLMPIIMPDYNRSFLTAPGGLDKNSSDRDLCEVMALDCWLNEAGQRREIEKGPNRLLETTPSHVHQLGDRHRQRILSLDTSNNSGGYGAVKEAAELLDTDVSRFTEAEAVFLLVAMYRATRLGQCVAHGARTYDVKWVFSSGGTVWMA